MRLNGFSPAGAHMSLPICSPFFRQQISLFGAVDFFYTANHQKFVRKTIPSTSSELDIMLLLACINNTAVFVRLVMYVPIGDVVEMYFPFNEGGDLFTEYDVKTSGGMSQRGKLRFQSRAIQIMIQVATGVQFLHANDLVHGDIKMENIFLNSDGSVCIGDFGHTGTTAQLSGTTAGTIAYLSPEMPYTTNPKAEDVYALAVMMFVIFVGSFPPWQRANDDETFGQQCGFLIHYGPHNIKAYTDMYNKLPVPFTDFLTKMLTSSSADRPDITIFLHDLMLLQDHVWKDVCRRLIF
jgi:serine/threonine protein kinase